MDEENDINTIVGDSIEEVYCNVAVKLNGNISIHTFIELIYLQCLSEVLL